MTQAQAITDAMNVHTARNPFSDILKIQSAQRQRQRAKKEGIVYVVILECTQIHCAVCYVVTAHTCESVFVEVA